jgi:hypothetical protein
VIWLRPPTFGSTWGNDRRSQRENRAWPEHVRRRPARGRSSLDNREGHASGSTRQAVPSIPDRQPRSEAGRFQGVSSENSSATKAPRREGFRFERNAPRRRSPGRQPSPGPFFQSRPITGVEIRSLLGGVGREVRQLGHILGSRPITGVEIRSVFGPRAENLIRRSNLSVQAEYRGQGRIEGREQVNASPR